MSAANPVGIINHIHAFDLVMLFTIMDQYSDGSPAGITRIYYTPKISSDNGFSAVGDAYVGHGVTITPSISGNNISFNLTTAGGLISGFDTCFTDIWELDISSGGSTVASEDGDWLSDEITVRIAIIMLPYWRCQMPDFVNLRMGESFSGQGLSPSVPWGPYFYDGTHGQLWVPEYKNVNGSEQIEAICTGLRIDTEEDLPNQRMMFGTVGFRGAFQIFGSASYPYNGLPNWPVTELIAGVSVYRCISPALSPYQVAEIATQPITMEGKDTARIRGMALILIEDSHLEATGASWVKSKPSAGATEWNIAYSYNVVDYTGKIRIDHGTVMLTGTRQGLMDDEPVVITAGPYYIDPTYDIPPKGTWNGFDFERGLAIWHINNRYAATGIIDKYVEYEEDGFTVKKSEEYKIPEPNHWHDIYAIDLDFASDMPDDVPQEVTDWIQELESEAASKEPPESLDYSTIKYDVYDNGTELVPNPDSESIIPQVVGWSDERILHITAPKEWWFVGDQIITPTTVFDKTALVYSPGGYINNDVVDLVPVAKESPDSEAWDGLSALSLSNQYSKLDNKCAILPGAVAAMFNAPPCAHNFARNLSAVTISFKIKTGGGVYRQYSTSKSESFYPGMESVMDGTSYRIQDSNAVTLKGSCTAVGIIDSANQDYIKFIFIGTDVTYDTENARSSYYITSTYNDPWMGGHGFSGDLIAPHIPSPDAVFSDGYVFGEMIMTTSRSMQDTRPTEVIYFSNFQARVREQAPEQPDVLTETFWEYWPGATELYTSERRSTRGAIDAVHKASFIDFKGERWLGSFAPISTVGNGGISLSYRARGNFNYYWDREGESPPSGFESYLNYLADMMAPNGDGEPTLNCSYDGIKAVGNGGRGFGPHVGNKEFYGDVKSVIDQMHEVCLTLGANRYKGAPYGNTPAGDISGAPGFIQPSAMLDDDFSSYAFLGEKPIISCNYPVMNTEPPVGFVLESKSVQEVRLILQVSNLSTLEITIS
jgi:hypothetical protein